MTLAVNWSPKRNWFSELKHLSLFIYFFTNFLSKHSATTAGVRCCSSIDRNKGIGVACGSIAARELVISAKLLLAQEASLSILAALDLLLSVMTGLVAVASLDVTGKDLELVRHPVVRKLTGVC